MKFFGILSALLVSSVTALPAPAPVPASSNIETRDLKSIQDSLTSLTNTITTLNKSVNSFNPVSLTTVGGILDVLKDTNAVGTQIIASTKAANQSAPLNYNDTLTLATQAFDLELTVKSLLANLVAKRPQFDSVAVILSVRKTVLEALQLDSQLAQQLASALTAKVLPEFQSIGDLIAMRFQADFDNAIAPYDKSMGGLELPAIPSKVEGDKVVNV